MSHEYTIIGDVETLHFSVMNIQLSEMMKHYTINNEHVNSQMLKHYIVSYKYTILRDVET